MTDEDNDRATTGRRSSSERSTVPDTDMRPERPTDEISFLQLAIVVLRHRRVVFLLPCIVAVIVVGVTLILPPSYTSTASFTPEAGGQQSGRFAGLASQFGIQVPTGEAGQSPQFYADLLTGRALLRETVLTEYTLSAPADRTDEEPRQGDLVDILAVEGETRRLAIAKTIDAVRSRVSVSTDPETGIVELSVTTLWPELSRQVAERMAELVNQFNLERRQTQASAEREFLEGQVAWAESTLHAVEDSLEGFLERNRSYQNSPTLRFEYERLQRRVNLRQQIFTSLSESLQQARINEVRNTPVITVVEPPEAPSRPDSRALVLKGLLGLALGGMFAFCWAFGREMMASTRERDPDDYAEFERLKRETKSELRELWQPVRGVFR